MHPPKKLFNIMLILGDQKIIKNRIDAGHRKVRNKCIIGSTKKSNVGNVCYSVKDGLDNEMNIGD